MRKSAFYLTIIRPMRSTWSPVYSIAAKLPMLANYDMINFMTKVKHEESNSYAWTCECGNTPGDQGFYPCDPKGVQVEPNVGWCGLYVCDECGAIIEPQSHEIVGRAPRISDVEAATAH
jgi:hypothetical protein